jgi:hypothetical protein
MDYRTDGKKATVNHKIHEMMPTRTNEKQRLEKIQNVVITTNNNISFQDSLVSRRRRRRRRNTTNHKRHTIFILEKKTKYKDNTT